MEQSLWEANTRSAGQEIGPFIRSTEVHPHVRKIPPLNVAPGQSNSGHTLNTLFFKVHFNIILGLTPKTWKQVFD
jgi:hypothetical protein